MMLAGAHLFLYTMRMLAFDYSNASCLGVWYILWTKVCACQYLCVLPHKIYSMIGKDELKWGSAKVSVCFLCLFLGSAVNNLCTCKSLWVPEVVCPRAPLPGDVFSGCAWAQDLSGVCCQGYLFYLCSHPAIKSLSGSKTPQKTSLKVSILRPCPCFVVWPFSIFCTSFSSFFHIFLN